MVSRLVCLASLLLLLTSCGVFKRAPKTPAAQEPPAVLEVGQIDMVNEIQKFVLIHAPGRVTLSPGTLMDVIGPEGIKARVKLAPERKGSYLTADIESGIPAKGDGVVWHRTPPPSPGASTAEPSPAEENTGTFIDPLVPVPPAPVTPSPPVPSASISPPSASLSPSAPPPPP